jgi:hypothetical protein
LRRNFSTGSSSGIRPCYCHSQKSLQCTRQAWRHCLGRCWDRGARD